MDKLSFITLLLDFYGNLLTEKQRMIMSYHFEEDMSLSEISEELNISRQAVHDIIKRSEKILFQYEDDLKLVDKFLKQRQKLIEVKSILSAMKDDRITKAIDIIDELIEL
ncbi:putative DNA-binding protein [Caloramator mitchellensis]|uniref:UPF0122 protein ABG79_01146 n=1 Tax=Caloramator mitchellensis TaxID=908809 RepID=A0A0R3K132_CALMK|nr:YlxM family DNA-binding protein [Caloramator mitchellensis]KRQ86956.1 putative DNA-binding protein [Caloramator mitchellensis]